MKRRAGMGLFLLALSAASAARAADPVVSNLTFAQREDGSGRVDVHFELADADGDQLAVRLAASGDGGLSWLLPCLSLSGDVGLGVSPGPGRHVLWEAGADLPGLELSALRLRVLANDDPGARDMLRLPAGSFAMGETGARQVRLSRDFQLDRRELSNTEFRELLQWALGAGQIQVLDSKVLSAPGGDLLMDLADPSCELAFDAPSQLFSLRQAPDAASIFPSGYAPGPHPVKSLSWKCAALVCNWLSLRAGLPPAYSTANWSCNGGQPYLAQGFRLPTEAEWEYAARLADGRLFPWGAAPADCEHCNGKPAGSVCLGWSLPVGSLPAGASQVGLDDLAGNQAEYCNDWWGPLGADSVVDPVGPGQGFTRILRGGDFLSLDAALKTTARAVLSPELPWPLAGLRVARSCDNSFPAAPSAPSPPDGAILLTDTTTLRWTATDPEGLPLHYDLYLDGLLAAADLSTASFPLAGLLPDSAVRWQVLARDAQGLTQWGPAWSFESWTPPVGEGLRFDFDQPYFAGAPGELLADHCLVLDAGLYHCFHIYEYPDTTAEQLGHLTSPDLRRWTREPDILPVAEGEVWERWGIWAPQVIPNPDPSGPRWLMLYTGVAGEGRPQQIGLAFSEDLFDWWRADADHEALNPFYHPTADYASWDEDPETPDWVSPCRDPFVFFEDGHWWLLNTGKALDRSGLILLAESPPDSFVFQGYDAPAPLMLREDLHQPESVQLWPVDHADSQRRWHLFYSDLSGTRHQMAADPYGGAAGWSGQPQSGDNLGVLGYAAAELTPLAGQWVFSQHRFTANENRYLLRFASLDFEASGDGRPTLRVPGGVGGIVGTRNGQVDSTLTWELIGQTTGHAFEHQPTWGDNPLYDASRGYSSGLTGNSYLATYERRPLPDQGAAGDHYGDYGRVGWIRSAPFRLQRNRLRLLVGGGDQLGSEFVALVEAGSGNVFFRATGENSHVLSPRVWDTESLRGRWVTLVVADLSGEDWGCIAADAIVAQEDQDGSLPGEAPATEPTSLAELLDAAGFPP